MDNISITFVSHVHSSLAQELACSLLQLLSRSQTDAALAHNSHVVPEQKVSTAL
jgi:hypothetical protein